MKIDFMTKRKKIKNKKMNLSNEKNLMNQKRIVKNKRLKKMLINVNLRICLLMII